MIEIKVPSGKVTEVPRPDKTGRKKADWTLKNLQSLSSEEAGRLLAELLAEQEEMEIQNVKLHQTLKALEASQAAYVDLYDTAPFGYLTLSKQGLILQANLAAAAVLGVERDALIMQKLSTYIFTKDLSTFSRHHQQLIESETSQVCEFRIQKKKDVQLWVRLEEIATKDDSGASMYRAGLSDITERKGAEAALAEETTRRRILFEQSPDGIVVIDPQTTRFIEFNTAVHQQLGYSREEFAKLSIADIEAKETPQETRKTIASVISAGRTDFETLQRTKSGEIRNVLVTAQYIDIGGKSVYQSIFRDVTKYVHAEAELRSQSRFPAENHNPILRIEKDGKIIYANLASEPLLRLWNCTVGEYLPPEWRQQIANAAKSGARTTTEVECKEQIYSIMIAPIPGCGYVNLYGSDITERKQREQEIRDAKILLQACIESPRDMIIMATDKDYRYLCFNNTHKAAMKYAYGKDVEIGMNILDCIASSDDRQKAKANYDRALAGESHTTVEEYGDVQKSYYESYYNPILNSRNEIIGMTAFASDITERKLMELALKESEGKFRSITEQTSDLISLTDVEGRIMFASSRSKDIFQFTPEEMCGHNFMEFLDESAIPIAKAAFRVAMERRERASNLELMMKRKDGSLFVGELNGSEFRYGEQAGSLVVIRDISERKQAEATMAEQLDELRRWHEVTLGREGRVLELKKEVNDLLAQIGQEVRYPSALEGA